MAILYPPDARAKDAPNGPEHYVLEMLRCQLDDSWHIVPNLRIAEHTRHLDGESDVVLLHANGVIVLEVKGGKISRTPQGEWIQNDAKRITSPILQASDNMHAVREYLHSAIGRTFPVCFCCVFPDSAYGASSIEAAEGQIIDAVAIRSVGLGLSLELFHDGFLSNYEHKLGKRKKLHDGELRRLAGALLPGVSGTVTPTVSINLSKLELAHLESEQLDQLGVLLRNPRVCIEGSAGTGKTALGLFACFERLKANPSHKGAFVCWSAYLANDIREKVKVAGYGGRLSVYSRERNHSMEKHFWSKIYVRKKDFEIKMSLTLWTEEGILCCVLGRDPTGLEGEELLRFMAECSDAGLFEHVTITDPLVDLDRVTGEEFNQAGRFDFIVIDEGQDFLNNKPPLAMINMMVKGGLLKGRVLWIQDMLQSIRRYFDPSCRSDIAIFDPEGAGYVMVPLPDRNYRNPPSVAKAAFAFRGDTKGRTLRQPSLRAAIHFIECTEARLSDFGEALISVIESGVSADDILVVSVDGTLMPKFKEGYNLGNGRYLGVVPPGRDSDINKATDRCFIRCCDILDAKGREFPVVFLVDLPPDSNEAELSLLYVAMTRCTDSLYVAGSPGRLALYRDFFGTGFK